MSNSEITSITQYNLVHQRNVVQVVIKANSDN